MCGHWTGGEEWLGRREREDWWDAAEGSAELPLKVKNVRGTRVCSNTSLFCLAMGLRMVDRKGSSAAAHAAPVDGRRGIGTARLQLPLRCGVSIHSTRLDIATTAAQSLL